jgi:tRNA threonylcarbamoyl adenosine modification protein YeaZ
MAPCRRCRSLPCEAMLVAIETSTDVGSVAIGSGNELLGEVTVGTRTRHAESLLPALDFLLRTTRLSREAVQGIVVGGGPGSFTGVRIAAATARGLVYGLGVPLYAYSSLAAVAVDAPVEGAVCALFDARRGEVYAACYERSGTASLRTILEPTALPIDELRDRLSHLRPAWIGEGAIRYARELGIAAPPPLPPRASALLRLAAHDSAHGGRGRVLEPAGWEPSYLRGSGAERGVAG